MKFNRGDKVKIKECAAIRTWPGWRDAINQVGFITFEGSQPETYLIDDNKFGINFTDEMVEAVDAFKVGDRVRIVGINADHGEGVILQTMANESFLVKHDSWHGGHSGTTTTDTGNQGWFY